MEVKNKKTYLSLWLCISILFHLLMTMIGIIGIRTESKKSKNLEKNNDYLKKIVQDKAKITSKTSQSFVFVQDTKEKAQSSQAENQKREIMNDDDLPHQNKKSKFKELSSKTSASKHRPAKSEAEKQLEKSLKETITTVQPAKKKKFSLADLKQGFTKYLQEGNDTFNLVSNSDETNTEGLKRLSYIRQVGEMYTNTQLKFVIHRPDNHLVKGSSRITTIIARSGVVESYRISQSCGDEILDNYHLDMIKEMGLLPRIPKYIQAPLELNFLMQWNNNENSPALQLENMPKLQL